MKRPADRFQKDQRHIPARSGFPYEQVKEHMSFVQSFVLDPIRLKSPALAKFRFFQLLHVRTNGAFDRLYKKWRSVVSPAVSLPPSQRMDGGSVATALVELKREGCVVLPFRLSAEEIAAITDFAFTVPAYATDVTQRIKIDRYHIPSGHGRYYWPMSELVNSPAVKNLLSDSVFYDLAQGYLGSKPLLAHVTLWLDPVYDGYYDPHVYHYDNDGPGFLKYFFYITDVTKETGAHRFIKRSHDHTKPEKFKLSRRYEDAELMDHYGAENEIIFEGPAGSIIAEDTAGFHRGTTLKRDYRLLMQFQFSLIDIPHEEDLAGVTRPIPAPTLNPGIASIARKFFRA